MPYDCQKNAPAVIPSQFAISNETLEAFCKFYGFGFHAVGQPPEWNETEVFRVGTHTYPSRGYTVRFEKVEEWKRAFDCIGEQVFENGKYRHYDGKIFTTICQDKKGKMAYRDEDGENHFIDVNDFFTVVEVDGALTAKVTKAPDQ